VLFSLSQTKSLYDGKKPIVLAYNTRSLTN